VRVTKNVPSAIQRLPCIHCQHPIGGDPVRGQLECDERADGFCVETDCEAFEALPLDVLRSEWRPVLRLPREDTLWPVDPPSERSRDVDDIGDELDE